MRKIFFAIASLFALVLAGCEKEENTGILNSPNTIVATIDNAAATKAVLDEKGKITSTLDRDRLCFAATPQGFSVSLYRKALEIAEREKTVVTDDNMLLEHIGEVVHPVYISENPKITTPEDMLYAEFLLRKRGCTDG